MWKCELDFLSSLAPPARMYMYVDFLNVSVFPVYYIAYSAIL